MGLLLFTAAASGQIVGSSSVRNPVVVFNTPGTKQVNVQICNQNGCTTATRTVTVLDPMPRISSLAGVPSLVGRGDQVILSAQTAGRPPLVHNWVLSGPANVTLTGNPVTWNTSLFALGTYSLRLDVQNVDGSTSSTPFTVSVQRMTFSDVPPTHWAWQYVETLSANGITTGCAPGLYCPLNNVLRAEMAVFLTRASHGSAFAPALPTGLFADVGAAYWAAPQIEQLYHDGITTGCAANPLRFCPAELLARAEMAVFLVRARHGASFTPPAATGIFADAPADYWAAPWIEQLYHDGITTGCASNPLRFCPTDNVSRDQMAAFLVRTFGLTGP